MEGKSERSQWSEWERDIGGGRRGKTKKKKKTTDREVVGRGERNRGGRRSKRESDGEIKEV